MAEETVDFNKLIDPLSNVYGLDIVTQAIIALIEWYSEQEYEDDDTISDWQSGYDNCEGIEKLIELLQIEQLSNNENSGKILYSHCCYYLLPDQPRPDQPIPTEKPFQTAQVIQNSNESIRIKQTDTALSRYYKSLDKPYNSLFAMFCNDNGLDDDAVAAEMIEAAQDSILIEFDKDFPFDQEYKTQHDKQVQIHKIVKNCYNNPNIEFGVKIPQFNETFFETNNDELAEVEEIYRKQCSSIYQAGLNKTLTIVRLLAIGKKHNFNYLSNLLDDYYRSRVENFSLTISEEKWFEEHHHKKEIKDITIKASDGVKAHKASQLVSEGIEDFARNIFPKLLFSPIINIDDSLEITVRYIVAAIESVGKLIKKHQDNDKNPFPFHTDLCIAYKKPISVEVAISMPNNVWDHDDEDDDDEEDDDDGYDEKDEWKDTFYAKFVGDISKKLHKHNIKYEHTEFASINVADIIAEGWFRGNIDIYAPMDVTSLIINFCGKIKHFAPTFQLFSDLYTKFIMNQKKDETYPKNKRLVTFIDRRHQTTDNVQDEVDEIWMYEPNLCQNIPNENEIAELWYLNASRTCLLPNLESYNYIDDLCGTQTRNDEEFSFNDNVGTAHHCKGTLLTLSLHAKSIDEIKCYLHWNGQIMRFMPKDIVAVLPALFYKQWNNDKKIDKNALSLNKKFKNNKELNQLFINKIDPIIKDKYFHAFRQQYG